MTQVQIPNQRVEKKRNFKLVKFTRIAVLMIVLITGCIHHLDTSAKHLGAPNAWQRRIILKIMAPTHPICRLL